MKTNERTQKHAQRSIFQSLRTLAVGMALAAPLIIGATPISMASGAALTTYNASHTQVVWKHTPYCPGTEIPCD